METRIADAASLGAIIKDTRKAQGLTQTDVCGLTGLGRRFICDLENGKPTTQVGKVIKVMAALGIAFIARSTWR